MSLSQELKQLAQELQGSNETEIAVGHLKQAGLSEDQARAEVLQMEMEKEAAEHLVMKGIDIDQAVSMVKAANIDVKKLSSAKLEAEIIPEVELLLKAASHMEDLENQVKSLTQSIESQAATFAAQAEPVIPEALTKVASSGILTREDLAQLSSIAPETLTKVASALEQPWEMGKAAGIARPKTDPLLEFCLA